MPKKVMTQRDIKKSKDNTKEPMMSVTNPTNKMVHIQIRHNKDFFLGEQTIRIAPGKTYTDRQSAFNHEQLKNLRAKGELTTKN